MSVINTNTQALSIARQLGDTQTSLSASLSRLSSGSKIVNPSDDAAGLAVSEKLDSQNLRIQAASTNVQNGVSYVQTADGFLKSMSNVLSRMSELATLSQDVTKSSSDIELYQAEFSALQEQLRSTIGGSTSEIGGTQDVDSPIGTFNGVTLFGSDGSGLTITIGADIGQTMTIEQSNLREGSMQSLIEQDGTGAFTLSLSDATALDTITSAVSQVATERAELGAKESRLDLASAALTVQSQNLESAISSIRDVDVAEESTQYAKYEILQQAGTAMLAQANQSSQTVLKLLE